MKDNKMILLNEPSKLLNKESIKRKGSYHEINTRYIGKLS